MKRDVMRLGEDHLYARYTNLKKKQQQEEEMMQRMLVGTSPQKVKKDIRVPQVGLIRSNGMLDKKKFVVDVTED